MTLLNLEGTYYNSVQKVVPEVSQISRDGLRTYSLEHFSVHFILFSLIWDALPILPLAVVYGKMAQKPSFLHMFKATFHSPSNIQPKSCNPQKASRFKDAALLTFTSCVSFSMSLDSLNANPSIQIFIGVDHPSSHTHQAAALALRLPPKSNLQPIFPNCFGALGASMAISSSCSATCNTPPLKS